MLDVERLIFLVKENSEIYDAKHKNHRNREHIAALWRSIAEELESTEIEVKAKWGNLRSNFMREKRKWDVIPTGSTATPKITWPFYEMLTFLENKNSKELVPETDATSLNDWVEEPSLQIKTEPHELPELQDQLDDDTNDFAPGNIYSETFPVVAEASSWKKRKRRSSSGDDKKDRRNLKDLKIVSSEGADCPIDDSDVMFFRSLLPMMKKLGAIANLEFKGEVIQILARRLQRPSRNS